MEHFFKPHRVFAVAGATTSPQKFGNKVFKWYKDRDLPVVPINYKQEAINGTPSVADVTKVPVPKGSDLALSVVTPIPVTKELLKQLDNAQGPVASIWFQPNTFDAEALELAKQKVPEVISDSCILVKGDTYLPSKL